MQDHHVCTVHVTTGYSFYVMILETHAVDVTCALVPPTCAQQKDREEAEKDREREKENERQRAAAVAAKAQLIAQGNTNLKLNDDEDRKPAPTPKAATATTTPPTALHVAAPAPQPPPPAGPRPAGTPTKEAAEAAPLASGQTTPVAAPSTPRNQVAGTSSMEGPSPGPIARGPAPGFPAPVAGPAPAAPAPPAPPGMPRPGTQGNWLSATTGHQSGDSFPQQGAVAAAAAAQAGQQKNFAAKLQQSGPGQPAAGISGVSAAPGKAPPGMGSGKFPPGMYPGQLKDGESQDASMDQLVQAAKSLSVDADRESMMRNLMQQQQQQQAQQSQQQQLPPQPDLNLQPVQPVFSTQAAKAILESCYT